MISLLWTIPVYALAVLASRRSGLLSLDTRNDRRVLLALLLLLAGASSTAYRQGADDVVANPIVLETALRGLFDVLALVVVLPILANTPWRLRLRGHVAAASLIAYVGMAGVSTLYSVAPIVTAGKAFELAVGLLVILTAMHPEPGNTSGQLQAAIRVVVVTQAALLVIAIVGFFAMPGTFSALESRPGFILSRTLVAPYDHSNGLSSTAALVSVYALAEVLTGAVGLRRRVWIALALVGALGVVLASGRQGVVMWMTSMAVLLWVLRRRLLVLLIAPATIGVVLAYSDVILTALVRGQPSVTLDTWSGRLTFWQAAVGAWAQHPWLGHGFGVGGRFVALRSIGSDEIPSLHSGYMEALTGLGVIGVVPLLAAVALVAVWALRSYRDRRDVPMAILLIPLLLRTLVSNGFGAWLNPEFLILAALALAADEARRRGRTPESSDLLQFG